METELGCWIVLNKVPGIGPATLRLLVQKFGAIKQLWQATQTDFAEKQISFKLFEKIQIAKREQSPEKAVEELHKFQINAITFLDKDYPELLKQIYNAPAILYYKGKWDKAADQISLAVVGTRKASSYGKEITEKIVKQLTIHGMTIISGLALGVDACVHETVLQNQGRTIAVLANGLDQIYPLANKKLGERIVNENGLLVSEFPIGTQPLAYNFPQRNRIISGLALGTLITEAGEESGALITASYALEQNREVFAMPGSIFNSNSQGCHKLIKNNQAKLVTKASDVLEELNLGLTRKFLETKEILPENQQEATLLKLVSAEPAHIDTLIRESGLPSTLVIGTVNLMVLQGKLKDLGNNQYIKSG